VIRVVAVLMSVGQWDGGLAWRHLQYELKVSTEWLILERMGSDKG